MPVDGRILYIDGRASDFSNRVWEKQVTWSDTFLGDYFTQQELDNVNKRIRMQMSLRAAGNRQTRERIDELEQENAKLALMLRALTEVCVRKGLFSGDELQAMVTEVDLWDGVEDGRYGPPPKRDEIEDDSAPSPHEFLSELERRDDV